MNNESVKNAKIENVTVTPYEDCSSWELVTADVIIDGVKQESGYAEYINRDEDGDATVDRSGDRYAKHCDCNIYCDVFGPLENETEGEFDANEAISDLDDMIDEILNQN